MSSDAALYEENFTVTGIRNDTYDRVVRAFGTSNNSDTSFTLDINSELYPLAVNENVNMVIVTTLNLDGTKDEGRGWRNTKDQTDLSDAYEYVCYGKVYRHHDPGDGTNIKVYISFGGLLLLLDGPYKKLSPLRQDYVYLCMKR